MADFKSKSGKEAESTEVGVVVAKLMDYFEQMDLPENIKDLRIVILGDTDTQGVFAGSEGYRGDGDGPIEMIEAMMVHTKVLLAQGGIDMQVMNTDELRQQMMRGSQN